MLSPGFEPGTVAREATVFARPTLRERGTHIVRDG